MASENVTVQTTIHECNNHLAVIWGYVQLLNEKAELSEQELKWVEHISRECKQLKACIGKLAAVDQPEIL